MLVEYNFVIFARFLVAVVHVPSRAFILCEYTTVCLVTDDSYVIIQRCCQISDVTVSDVYRPVGDCRDGSGRITKGHFT